jgi:hypothetical protein
MYVLAIDPGIMNLALAVIEVKTNTDVLPTSSLTSLASLCACTRLAYWDRIDLSGGIKNATHTQLCAKLIAEFDRMNYLFGRCQVIGIEHQMASNHDANAVQNYALSYFMCRYPNLHVQLIRPLWKTQYLGQLSIDSGVPAFDLDRYDQRKKWSVATVTRCRELWKEMPDDLYCYALNWQFQPRTWIRWAEATPKQDDLADSALMILGWLVHTKGKLVPDITKKSQSRRRAVTTTPSLIAEQKLTRSQQIKVDNAFVSAGTDNGLVGRRVGKPVQLVQKVGDLVEDTKKKRYGYRGRRRKLVRQ